jgi:hypothetical protein
MSQKIYRGWHDDMLAGNVVSAVDLRIMLVMTNTTCDTEDAQTLSDFTTIDECDGVGYAQLDLAGVGAAWDAVNLREEWDATDGDMDGGGGSIAASARDVQGYVVYRYVDGTDANDVPWGYRDIGPYTTAGGPFDFAWNAEGIWQTKFTA